ncbi:hypothetical protein ACFQBY_18810 [Promicromonospora citrea]|uniref:HIRAN domain-containing protein n=1 Tax=Promicromonospora citrea TaxID=43677 RepID=A0A8H9L3W9_9MICO|nr:hypothetical protein [Promicromonospora citrea]NNH52334.1 hypothetical protein [Promicromonospora citrea]GGM23997.1 hypothetical protein GCM10010102_19620 [Promicromonospora citrea]
MASSSGPSVAARVLGICLLVVGTPLVLLTLALLVAGEVGVGLVVALPAAAALFGAARLLRRRRPGAPRTASHAKVPARAAAVSRRPSTDTSGPAEHVPPCPTGDPVDPWTTATGYAEVVGETFRQDAIRRVFAGTRVRSDAGAELLGQALLSDDSGNPHDSNAVAVWFEGEHVGYLSAGDARKYSPVVRELAAEGRVLRVEARAWARERPAGDPDGSGLGARVTVFPPPDLVGIRPVNDLPRTPHVVLPPGRTVQVTKEDQHMAVLGEVVAHGSGSGIVATLHAVVEQRARSTAELVEVRYDGQRVGVLSTPMSAQLLPLVRYIESRGKVAVARATVAGSRLQADITLDVARTTEIDDAWIAGSVDSDEYA